MTETRNRLVAALRETPATLAGLVGACESAAVSETAPGPDGEWPLGGIVLHFVHAEEAWLERRLALMLAEDDPALPFYDDPDYLQPPPAQASLEDFTRRRAASVERLGELPPAAWTRTGRHERYGRMTLETAVAHIVAHDAQHLAQIARRLTS